MPPPRSVSKTNLDTRNHHRGSPLELSKRLTVYLTGSKCIWIGIWNPLRYEKGSKTNYDIARRCWENFFTSVPLHSLNVTNIHYLLQTCYAALIEASTILAHYRHLRSRSYVLTSIGCPKWKAIQVVLLAHHSNFWVRVATLSDDKKVESWPIWSLLFNEGTTLVRLRTNYSNMLEISHRDRRLTKDINLSLFALPSSRMMYSQGTSNEFRGSDCQLCWWWIYISSTKLLYQRRWKAEVYINHLRYILVNVFENTTMWPILTLKNYHLMVYCIMSILNQTI